MMCLSCKSSKQSFFPAEINIHLPGLEGLDKQSVWAFPSLLVCSECGLAQFKLSQLQLGQLRPEAQDGSGIEVA
jgi:hypothetical protein